METRHGRSNLQAAQAHSNLQDGVGSLVRPGLCLVGAGHLLQTDGSNQAQWALCLVGHSLTQPLRGGRVPRGVSRPVQMGRHKLVLTGLRNDRETGLSKKLVMQR